ncbi:hypothetical protein GBA52_003697 [Prunus armeniaca]|nr:hypothetical protein GBA52_003697 [Prunus armeniaca]
MLPTQAPRPVPIDSPPPPRFIPPLIVGEKLAERHLDRRKNLPKLVLFVDNNFGNFRLRHHLEKGEGNASKKKKATYTNFLQSNKKNLEFSPTQDETKKKLMSSSSSIFSN